MMKRWVWGLAFAVLLVAGPARADDVTAGIAKPAELEVKNAWSRALPPVASTGAVYLTLVNRGAFPRRLLSASSPVAERVEIHSHAMSSDGMVKMRKVEAVEVSARAPVIFKPHGLHVMLIGLKQPLVADKRFSLTLRFERGEVLETQFEVR